jgi:hypothetical protein
VRKRTSGACWAILVTRLTALFIAMLAISLGKQ